MRVPPDEVIRFNINGYALTPLLLLYCPSRQ
jgi:hypothetical protein